MLHRTTWFAIPIIALVVAGAAAGWWNYFDQNQQRQAMAIQLENTYASSFHNLVDDIHHLHESLGKSLVTGSTDVFSKRMRDVWRLSYAAQTEVARLPFSLMPMHHTQQFLATVGEDAANWMSQSASPRDSAIQTKLQGLYKDSGHLMTDLAPLQTAVLDNGVRWLPANLAMNRQKADNQIVDGFRKMDSAAQAFVEADDNPTSMQRAITTALARQQGITGREAGSRLAEFLNTARTQPWSVKATRKGAVVSEYVVGGSSPLGPVNGFVSSRGGHVISFHVDRVPRTGGLDMVAAVDHAQQWLASKGFGRTAVVVSNQLDHTAYFIMAPMFHSVPVYSQGIAIKEAMDNGQILAFDAHNYYYYPVRSLPSRVYSPNQLLNRLGPGFQVRETLPVIVLDAESHYQPAVAFYGTSNGETYCVYINAHTGKELDVEQLTNQNSEVAG